LSRNVLKIIILCLISAAVGAYIHYDKIGSQISQKSEGIFNFNADDVDEIVLTRGKRSVFLKRDNHQWMVKEPFESLVDNEKILRLLTIFDYGVVRVVEAAPSDYTLYGLDQPEMEISIVAGGDCGSFTFQIGKDNPTVRCCYAKVEDRSEVLLIGKAYKTELERAIAYFQFHKGG